MARKLLVAVAVLVTCGPGAALGATWTNSGPSGAVVQAIAADPVTDFVVYVGVRDGGVFKSDPNGATSWQVFNNGLGNLNVRSIATSPAGGGVVLAGTNAGIYRTGNGGGSWTLASGPPAEPIDEIAFDPTNPAIAYAVSFSGWIGKSTDGGASWQALGGPASAQRPQAVHVDPTNGSVVYVGTIDDGVYKSTNAGSAWTAQNEGLTNLHVSAIAVDPTSPSTVYAGTDNGGAFRSTDGGATWTAFTTGVAGNDVDAIVVNRAGRAFLANSTGVFGTTDQALGWTRLSVFAWANDLALGPGDPGAVWEGFGQIPQSSGGVAYSPGSGQFTFVSPDGLNGVTVSGIAVDPSNPGSVLAVGSRGADLSLNGGGSWQGIEAPALSLSVAFDPQAPGVAYLGYASGVGKSTDGGVEWISSSTGLPAGPNPPVVRAVLVLPGAAGRVLAGTVQGVYRSEDAGANWAAPGTPTPAVYSLARNPSSTNTWAGAEDGVYRSTDDGANWARSGNAAGPVYALLDSAVTPKIFAGNPGGLLVSSDSGASWTAVGGGLPASQVFALVEDPDRSAIYAGGAAGVFESLDGGVTWAPAAEGLANPYVLSLAVLPNGTLLAGARGGSVFRRIDVSTVDRGPVERSDGRGETRDLPPRP